MILQDPDTQKEESTMLEQLPPLSVDSMTQVQLTEVIPNLVQFSTGRQRPEFGENQFKPEWWPNEMPWVDPSLRGDLKEEQLELLREVVRSCYKHLGQENLLSMAEPVLPCPGARTEGEFMASQSADENRTVDLPVDKTEPEVTEATEETPIWVCFLCAKQFQDQETLMSHQEECEKEAEIQEAKQRILDIQRIKEQNEIAKQREAFLQRAKMRVIRESRKRKRRCLQDIYIPPPKSTFISVLDLKEKPKSEIIETSPKKEIDSDCEIIEVSYPTVPRTPRTPKSLMSQLSRDSEAHARRRHLSFSEVMSDSDSEGDNTKKQAINKSSLLFGIPITSPLGQRVKKHLKIDSTIPIVRNADVYCRGPTKNEFIEKLRQTERAYQVVYKKRKKFSSQFTHVYKFNSGQRKEFMITKKTGLTKRSRNLLCCLKDCCVILKRLKPSEIKEWCRPKPKPAPRPAVVTPRQPYFNFNSGSPSLNSHLRQILAKPLYGPKSARLKQINDNINRVRTSQSMQDYDMMTKVVTNADGTETMKVIYIPKKSTENRRKQNFNKVNRKPVDEDIQIIELSDSSDEESDRLKLSESPRKCPPQLNRAIRPSTPQSRTGILKPTSLSKENLVGRNSPIMKNSQIRSRSATITNSGLQFDNPHLRLALTKGEFSVSPPGAVSAREIAQKPTPSNTASRNINLGSDLGLRITNLQSLATAETKPLPTPILQKFMHHTQTVNMASIQNKTSEQNVQPVVQNTTVKQNAQPNILQRKPISIAALFSNNPDDAIVIEDDD